MDKKKILLVGQYFYPEQFRINDICFEWKNEGHTVEVVTGIPNYPEGKFYPGYGLLKKRKETYKGIKIYRIPQIPRGKSSFMLSLNYVSFVISGFLWSLFSKKDADVVFNYSTSPIFHALPGLWFAKRKGVPFYIYVLDLWPDSFESVTKIHSSFLNSILQRICDYIYENSDRIFVTSLGFVNKIASRGVSLEKIVYWPQYAEEFYRPIEKKNVEVSEIPHDDKFNLIFAGNFGYAQGLEVLPDVAKLIKDNGDNIRINMVGDGRFKDKLLDLINQKDVAEIFNFVDKQPSERIPEFMTCCDAALILLQDTELFRITIPAKFQSCTACGIPIVTSSSSEMKHLLELANCGVSAKDYSAEGLYNAICSLANRNKDELNQLGTNARSFFEDNFEKGLLLEKIDKYL